MLVRSTEEEEEEKARLLSFNIYTELEGQTMNMDSIAFGTINFVL